MNEKFNFRKDGRLVIDGTFYDQHYPNKYFVVINDKIYSSGQGFYRTGEELAAALKPVSERFVLTPSLEMRADFYLSFPCSPKIDKFKLRAATMEEIEGLKEKFNIKKISDPYTEECVSMYGDGEPIEERYVTIDSPDAWKIQDYFLERHASALTVPLIDAVKVRVDY